MQETSVAHRRRSGAGRTLLVSKLMVPDAAVRLVPRRRLFDSLDHGTQHGVTALVAPAGSGKTMLLASWIDAARPAPAVAWFSLDRGDNNPYLFWSYLVEALRRSGAEVARGRGAAGPEPDQWPEVHRDAHDSEIVAAILAAFDTLIGPLYVVLDDLHELVNPRVLTGLETLIKHAPRSVRWLLAGRSEPPLALSRLRVAGQLTEIRYPDLACTPQEAQAIFADLGLSLPPEKLEVVLNRTEGWVSGLRLAGLWLRDRPDPSAAVTEIGGDERLVADYLLDEVIAEQPEDVREFLLRTSVPGRITGDLADVLTGRRDGAQLLDALEQANVFLLAVGPRREWFRYHSLVLDLLRRELRHTRSATEVAALHRQTAQWFADHGLLAEAVQHAITGRDWEHAAQLLVHDQLRAFLDGRAEQLRPLLLKLPESLPAADPELALVFAVARLTAADPDGADAFLSLAEHFPLDLPADRRARLHLWRSALRLLQATQRGSVDRATAAEALHTLADETESAVEGGFGDAVGILHANLAMVQLWSGAHESAREHLDRARRRLTGSGYEVLELECASALALVDALAGALGAAEETGRSAIAAGESGGWLDAVGAAYLALAVAALERDELADAVDLLAQLDRAGAAPAVTALAAVVRARVLAAGGDPATAQQVLAGVRARSAGYTPYTRSQCALATADLLLRLGDLTGCRHALASVIRAPVQGRRPAEASAVARLLNAEENPAAALAAVAPVLERGDGKYAPLEVIPAMLAGAVATRALGDSRHASDLVLRAVELAEPDRLIRVFLDGGREVRALLTTAVPPFGTSARMRSVLLQRFDEIGAVRPHRTWQPVEQLTERELDVLRYLPSLMGNREIADDLYVSVNTVKAHLKSLYRKLEVTTRREAVARARQLGLI